MRKSILIPLSLLICLFLLAGCAVPELPESLDRVKNGKTYRYLDGTVTFTDPKDAKESGSPSERMKAYEYNMTFRKEYPYCLVRIDKIREVHAEFPTTVMSFEGNTISEESAVYSEGTYDLAFSVMDVTVVEVFRNSAETDFAPGDSIRIGTNYTVGKYGSWKYASHFQKGECYYLIPNPKMPLPENPSSAMILMDRAADFWTSAENCMSFRLLEDDQTVEISRCIWERKGFDREENYDLIRVPRADFERFYREKIEWYTKD